MFKSFTLASMAAMCSAKWQAGIYQGDDDFLHDYVWGHDHYEPGNVKRFDGHFAEIYGADDLAWGPNGFQNPQAAKDDTHNWDDQGDAYTCHSCGGHGCAHCGGYGHFHRNSQFGHHGHSLMNGFGVGHWHTYLGDKQRSSYNKYGHGMGGRYSQRWTNGYGDKYGIDAGQRYGLNHRWGIYNGLGKGNASSKGSNLGYGIGTNAALQQVYWDQDGGYADYGDDYYGDDYYGDDYYGDDYYGDDYYGDYGDDDHYYEAPMETYEEPAYEAEEMVYEEEPVYEEIAEPVMEEAEEDDHYDHWEPEPEYWAPEPEYYYEPEPMYWDPYLPVYNGQQYFTDFATGYGGDWDMPETTGRASIYTKDWSLGHGNHSPWHDEVHRHDRGVQSIYRKRPTTIDIHHENYDFPI